MSGYPPECKQNGPRHHGIVLHGDLDKLNAWEGDTAETLYPNESVMLYKDGAWHDVTSYARTHTHGFKPPKLPTVHEIYHEVCSDFPQ